MSKIGPIWGIQSVKIAESHFKVFSDSPFSPFCQPETLQYLYCPFIKQTCNDYIVKYLLNLLLLLVVLTPCRAQKFKPELNLVKGDTYYMASTGRSAKLKQLMLGNIEILDNPKMPGGMAIPMTFNTEVTTADH